MADPNIGGPARRKFKLNYDRFFTDPADQKLNQPFLMDLVTLEKLFFQTIPMELEYEPEANFVVVAPPGRNTPLYQYVGSEDTLNISLSWYLNSSNNPDQLLQKTKWLESLAKNDGYDSKPHKVALYFGDLYKGAKFIVKKVSVRLSLFNRETGMMPQLASTDITLARIEEKNRTRDSILKTDT